MPQHMQSRVNAPLQKIRVPHWSHEMKIKWITHKIDLNF
jgi:hypothetical protein